MVSTRSSLAPLVPSVERTRRTTRRLEVTTPTRTTRPRRGNSADNPQEGPSSHAAGVDDSERPREGDPEEGIQPLDYDGLAPATQQPANPPTRVFVSNLERPRLKETTLRALEEFTRQYPIYCHSVPGTEISGCMTQDVITTLERWHGISIHPAEGMTPEDNDRRVLAGLRAHMVEEYTRLRESAVTRARATVSFTYEGDLMRTFENGFLSLFSTLGDLPIDREMERALVKVVIAKIPKALLHNQSPEDFFISLPQDSRSLNTFLTYLKLRIRQWEVIGHSQLREIFRPVEPSTPRTALLTALETRAQDRVEEAQVRDTRPPAPNPLPPPSTPAPRTEGKDPRGDGRGDGRDTRGQGRDPRRDGGGEGRPYRGDGRGDGRDSRGNGRDFRRDGRGEARDYDRRRNSNQARNSLHCPYCHLLSNPPHGPSECRRRNRHLAMGIDTSTVEDAILQLDAREQGTPPSPGTRHRDQGPPPLGRPSTVPDQLATMAAGMQTALEQSFSKAIARLADIKPEQRQPSSPPADRRAESVLLKSEGPRTLIFNELAECQPASPPTIRVDETGNRPSMARLSILSNGEEFPVEGSLDSGADRTVGGLQFLRQFCDTLTDLKHPCTMIVAGNRTYPVRKSGTISVRVAIGKKELVIKRITCYLADTPDWERLLIGRDVLGHLKATPEDVLAASQLSEADMGLFC